MNLWFWQLSLGDGQTEGAKELFFRNLFLYFHFLFTGDIGNIVHDFLDDVFELMGSHLAGVVKPALAGTAVHFCSCSCMGVVVHCKCRRTGEGMVAFHTGIIVENTAGSPGVTLAKCTGNQGKFI